MKPIVMYVTYSCEFCQVALSWLHDHPQEATLVEVRFVDVDAAAQDDFREQRFRGVPAFVTEKDRWSG